MRILSFDCAVENMGVCLINHNENYRDELKAAAVSLTGLLSAVDEYELETFLQLLTDYLTEIDRVLNSVFAIEWFNVINLIPGKKIKEVPIVERTRRLKQLLNELDRNLPAPDVVLIEYQMKLNDISRLQSSQIMYHYVDESDSDIKYAVGGFSFSGVSLVSKPRVVELVGASLKNVYCFSADGEYSNFIVKYVNYTANKKHTAYNFKHYLDVFGGGDVLVGVKNKINDISDAFMMAYGWLYDRSLK